MPCMVGFGGRIDCGVGIGVRAAEILACCSQYSKAVDRGFRRGEPFSIFAFG